MREVRWERMFRDELEEAFARCPVAYFPYGLCEPHGHQCAVGLDALKAHGVCVAAARAHGGIVAPPDYWHIHDCGGYSLWSHRHVDPDAQRSWLTCMPPWQHFRNTLYHVRQADALGFKAIILMTGHYGPNWEDLTLLVELIRPHVGARIHSLPDFEANNPGFDNDGKSRSDHAGKVETSLLWALEPECVDMSRIPDGVPEAENYNMGAHFAMGPTVRLANRKTGERMVADEVRWLGDKTREMLAEFDRVKPTHRLRTFGQVEELWANVVRPRMKDFKTMQDQWPWQADWPKLPESSPWQANWRIPKQYF